MKTKKKEFLTQVAVDLFAKKGFAATTMRDIAKAAKANVALIYYYFNDKEEILYRVIESTTRDLITILTEIQSQDDEPFEGLKKMIVRQVIFSSKSWKETKLITSEADNLHGHFKKDCQNLQRQIYDIYKEQLLRMKATESLSDVNLTVVNFAIFGMINWFYRWYSENKSLSEEAIAYEMVKILELGIRKTETKPLQE